MFSICLWIRHRCRRRCYLDSCQSPRRRQSDLRQSDVDRLSVGRPLAVFLLLWMREEKKRWSGMRKKSLQSNLHLQKASFTLHRMKSERIFRAEKHNAWKFSKHYTILPVCTNKPELEVKYGTFWTICIVDVNWIECFAVEKNAAVAAHHQVEV